MNLKYFQMCMCNKVLNDIELETSVTQQDDQFGGCDEFRELYAELLKRLDDSNDIVRVATCKCFVAYFRALPAEWSKSLFGYIIASLFIHLDDPEWHVQG